jgi:ABC-type multidrug transport system ATPase subunit
MYQLLKRLTEFLVVVSLNLLPQQGKKDEGDRKLLSDSWGEVPEKQITAIMGPSGAGKVSLFILSNILLM